MTKPPFVFHGSCKGIPDGIMQPRPQDGDINGLFPDGKRNVVFATHDQDLAAVYTLKTSDMLNSGTDHGIKYAAFTDYDKWQQEIENSPCTVYALPTNSFTQTMDKRDGTPSIEWQSPVAVQADHTIQYTPEKVMQEGGQLFFLDASIGRDKWHYDQQNPDHDSFWNRVQAKHDAGLLSDSITPLQIYKALVDNGIMMHLNAKLGIRPATIQPSPDIAAIQEDIDWLKQQMAVTPERADGKAWAASLGARTGFTLSKP